jgi:hypothetical protein
MVRIMEGPKDEKTYRSKDAREKKLPNDCGKNKDKYRDCSKGD